MSQDAYIYDAIRTPRGRGKPGGGLYEAVLPLTGLEAGDRSFKVASSDWSTVNCGAGDPTVMPGIPYALFCDSSSGDASLDTDQTGTYRFEVDASQPLLVLVVVFSK